MSRLLCSCGGLPGTRSESSSPESSPRRQWAPIASPYVRRKFPYGVDYVDSTPVSYGFPTSSYFVSPNVPALDLAHNSNVQDAFVIAVEQQARERLERLSALKRIKPVDMTKLSQQVSSKFNQL